MNYYSQNGEDILLWDVFKDQKTGFYIDVGAFDGIYLSNSYIFEQNGWDGICVEASPVYFTFCENNRPKSICVNEACTCPEKRGTVTYLHEPLGVLSGIEAYRTTDIRERYARRNITFTGFTEYIVKSSTLDDLLAQHLPNPASSIDFLSIDVEGTEVDVLLGLSRNPRVIIVESHSPQQAEKINGHLFVRGYRAATFMGENTFFTNNEQDLERIRSAVASGRTIPTEHPLIPRQRQIAKEILINGTQVVTNRI